MQLEVMVAGQTPPGHEAVSEAGEQDCETGEHVSFPTCSKCPK